MTKIILKTFLLIADVILLVYTTSLTIFSNNMAMSQLNGDDFSYEMLQLYQKYLSIANSLESIIVLVIIGFLFYDIYIFLKEKGKIR